MTVSMNGDFHQFEFSGMAQDLLDSASFQAGQGGMSAFPAEPTPVPVNYALVPGNLGEVWMGVIPNQMFTVTQASVEIKNNLAMRENEYGTILPLAIAPGAREVTVTLEFYSHGRCSDSGFVSGSPATIASGGDVPVGTDRRANARRVYEEPDSRRSGVRR